MAILIELTTDQSMAFKTWIFDGLLTGKNAGLLYWGLLFIITFYWRETNHGNVNNSFEFTAALGMPLTLALVLWEFGE